MNIKKVDDKPMVIHTKEKPKVHVKGAPETKIKGRNILTVQHGPKIAGNVAEKSVAADGKIKLKKSSVYVTDKRKTVRTKTADGMEYRGRNGGGNAQDRKGNGTTQGRSGSTIQGRSVATEQGRSGGGTTRGRSGGGTAQGRYEGRTEQGRNADRNTQGRQGKEQEVRQSVNKENRMYTQYRIAKDRRFRHGHERSRTEGCQHIPYLCG